MKKKEEKALNEHEKHEAWDMRQIWEEEFARRYDEDDPPSPLLEDNTPPFVLSSEPRRRRRRRRSSTFYLSHVPRACYNSTTAPDAPERVDLEGYIVQQVTKNGFWKLKRIWRPLEFTTSGNWQPPPPSLSKEYLNGKTSLQEMQDIGAALLVFVHEGHK